MEYLMSVHYWVFLQDHRLPTISEWQHALDAHDTQIVLDQIDNLRSHMGYLPARYCGHPCGFEWFLGLASEAFDEVPEPIQSRPYLADFVTHSDLRELICSMIAGAVLAQVADGLVLDENSNEFIDGKRALEIAKEAEASYL
jgi:hypothetical protein